MINYEIQKLDYRIPETQDILSYADLSEFYSKCFKAEYSQHLDQAGNENMNTWLDGTVAEDMVAVNHTDTVTLASMYGSDLVGTAVYAEREGDEKQAYVYLWGMYVHLEKLRSGVGRNLIVEVANSVSPDSRIEVSVLQKSKGAMEFYKRLGFRTYKAESVDIFPNVPRTVEVMQCATKLILEL